MNVIYHTGILGQIINAIENATGHIARIEITKAEMKELVEDASFDEFVGKYYGSSDISVPSSVAPIKKDNEIPRWLVYRGIKIVRV